MDDKLKRIEELVKILNEASYAYYNGFEEEMSNYEWDGYRDELEALEKETGYILKDSPTQTVGASEDDLSGNKEPHEYPALSLAKTKSVDDLVKWANHKSIWLSWKLDGLTIVLTYDAGKLTKILTRGNGTIGTNITFLKDAIYDIPKTISYKGHLVVRGEATISYDDFELLNDTIENEDDKYSNPRNLAAGTLALDNPDEVKARFVHLNAFSLVHIDDPINSYEKQMDYLDELGFNTVERERIDDLSKTVEVVEKWTKKVESGSMRIPVDGLVICYDDVIYASQGSLTTHHATRGGYAFKWQDEEMTSTLDHIEWSCAASSITPVAVFDEIQLEGTTVSRASLCNISELDRLNIGNKGSKIVVIKANKIIPKVVRVEEKVGEYHIPELCPVCHAPTTIKKSIKGTRVTKTLHCTNPDCVAKKGKNFARFVSKSGFDMDGLSIKTMLKFINMGYITNFSDLFHLSEHFDVIKELDGFGEKSCQNMETSIESKREVSPINLIYALSIPMIGVDAAKKIVHTIGFDEFLNRMQFNIGFDDIDGIGSEKSQSILTWYQNKVNSDNLDLLLKEVKLKEVSQNNAEGKCANLTFVITGNVETYPNRKALQAYIESQGGKATSSVSNSTNYLINNDVNSSSSKNVKAKQLGVQIISEQTFNEMFGESSN